MTNSRTKLTRLIPTVEQINWATGRNSIWTRQVYSTYPRLFDKNYVKVSWIKKILALNWPVHPIMHDWFGKCLLYVSKDYSPVYYIAKFNSFQFRWLKKMRIIWKIWGQQLNMNIWIPFLVVLCFCEETRYLNFFVYIVDCIWLKLIKKNPRIKFSL